MALPTSTRNPTSVGLRVAVVTAVNRRVFAYLAVCTSLGTSPNAPQPETAEDRTRRSNAEPETLDDHNRISFPVPTSPALSPAHLFVPVVQIFVPVVQIFDPVVQIFDQWYTNISAPFSRYLAERPFPQSLALQTLLSFFVSFFLSFVLGQTNKNQSERLHCPEAPGARFMTQRSKTSKPPAARLNPTYKLPLTEPIAPVR